MLRIQMFSIFTIKSPRDLIALGLLILNTLKHVLKLFISCLCIGTLNNLLVSLLYSCLKPCFPHVDPAVFVWPTFYQICLIKANMLWFINTLHYRLIVSEIMYIAAINCLYSYIEIYMKFKLVLNT